MCCQACFKCSFGYLCVVHHMCCPHNVEDGKGKIKKIAESHFGSATHGQKKKKKKALRKKIGHRFPCILHVLFLITQAYLKIWTRQK